MAKNRYIFPPGSVEPKIIKGWDEIAGIPVCIRAAKVRRVKPPEIEGGWTDEDDDKLDQIKDKLASEKAKNPLTLSEANARKLKERIELYENNIAQEEKRRQPLTEWEDEQIRRCVEGHGTLTGRHYFYFHFGWIQSIKNKRRINEQPSMRQADDFLARLIDKATEDSTGFAGVKRRRIGLTWANVGMVTVYEMLFYSSTIFYASKDEADIIKFYKRVQYFIEMLPRFLRPKKRNWAERFISLEPHLRIAEVMGIDPSTLNIPELRSGTPDNAANFAGDGVSKLIVDEAGEIQGLGNIFAWGEPMLKDSGGLKREGAMLVYGTVGEMLKAGQEFQSMFVNADAYDLMPVFIPGWMGINMDECGNDLKEKTIAEIEKQRKKFIDAGLIQQEITHRQKYPLTIEDAFSFANAYSVLPLETIQAMREDHMNHPPKMSFGFFYFRQDGSVGFQQQGAKASAPENKDWIGYNQWTIFEHPKPTSVNIPYIQGVDPVPIDKSNSQRQTQIRYKASDIGATIYKRFATTGGISFGPVAYYHGRPDKSAEAFRQIVLAAIYYGAMTNIERQNGHELFNLFLTMGQEHLIAKDPGAILGLTKALGDWGFHNQPAWWTQCMLILKKYWISQRGNPHHRRLYDEMMVVGQKNADLSVSFMAALMFAEEIEQRIAAGMEKNEREGDGYEPHSIYQNYVVNERGQFINRAQPSDRVRALLNRRYQ